MGHFIESFQATDKETKHNTTYTRNTKDKHTRNTKDKRREKPALANRTN